MFILVGICIWVLGFCKLEALGALMSSFEICSHIVAKWSCSSLCLFQWNWWVTCHRWKNNQWLSHWKWKRLLDGIKAHSIHDLYSYMWWGIYHIDLAKLSINTWVHFQCKTLSIVSQLIFIYIYIYISQLVFKKKQYQFNIGLDHDQCEYDSGNIIPKDKKNMLNQRSLYGSTWRLEHII